MSGVDPLIAADGETSLGVPLMKRYLSEVTGEFDLIMFNHSLEHVPDPVATLKAAYLQARCWWHLFGSPADDFIRSVDRIWGGLGADRCAAAYRYTFATGNGAGSR